MIPIRETRKAVILARGLGKRMRAGMSSTLGLTDAQRQMADRGMKGMIPVGRPFLDYCIAALADAGCRQVCLVIGPEHKVVSDYYKTLSTSRVTISFAIQEKALGTANALVAAADFVGSDCFLVVNSDNYYPVEALRRLRALESNGVIGFERQALIEEGNITEERLQAYATLDLNPEGELLRIEEKPEGPHTSNSTSLVSMNCWSFTTTIFRACSAITPSPRGEYEIPSAVQYAIESLGERFRVLPFQGGVLDLSTSADIAAVARHLHNRPVQL